MAIRKKLIKERVEEILAANEITSAPIPIEQLIRSYGISIREDKVDDSLSGFLFRDPQNTRVIIGTNKTHHPNRQRFTLAHELGHYLLHEGERVRLDESRVAYKINRRDAVSATGEDDIEKEANMFAAELLMPEKFIEQDLHHIDLDLLDPDADYETLATWAQKYKVSIQALTFRLANLGYIDL
jgi:Zn-dependent peptidase ImmA (M78 family)